MNILHIWPPYLSDVATFPWEIQKSFLTVLLLSASYCLHSPIMSGACYRSACVEYQSMIPTSCGRGLLRGAWCDWAVAKDWKHVFMQNVVTLNTCCDVACLTFQLSQITTSSFQSHQCQPANGSFQSHRHLKGRNKKSVRWSCQIFSGSNMPNMIKIS